MTEIRLSKGTLDGNDNMDGWVITSDTAIVEGNDDLILRKGDRIHVNGDVYRGEELLGNVG